MNMTEQDYEESDVQWLMSTKSGRRVVSRIMEQCGIYQCSFTGDANKTIFNEGQRNAGLQLLGQIHAHCPEQYPVMLREFKAFKQQFKESQS